MVQDLTQKRHNLFILIIKSYAVTSFLKEFRKRSFGKPLWQRYSYSWLQWLFMWRDVDSIVIDLWNLKKELGFKKLPQYLLILDGLLISPSSSNLNFNIILSNWGSVALKSCQIKLHRLLWKFEFYNLDIQSWMSSH